MSRVRSSRAGYVLVGGRSSRMGRDKARLPFRDLPLAASIARQVEQAAGSATLIGNPSLYHDFGYPVTPDLYPGEGPLGGILTALDHTRAEWNLVTACDMPALTAGFLELLLACVEDSNADVVLPSGPSGLPEPLCAVWRRGGLPTIRTAFHTGVRKVTAAMGDLRIHLVPVAQVSHFQNVNTPEDWLEYGAG